MNTLILVLDYALFILSDQLYSDISDLVMDLQVIIDNFEELPPQEKYITGTVVTYYDDVSMSYVTDGELYEDYREVLDNSIKLTQTLNTL